MFDEIRDFVVKNKIWFIICGSIFAIVGTILAALISLYFLIAVAVGLIVAVAFGFMKNKEIKRYEQQTTVRKEEMTPGLSTPTPDNKELEEYKKEARERITKEYVQELLTSFQRNKKINESEDMCSSLIQDNGLKSRGDGSAFKIIKKHFSTIEIKNISKNFETAIRGDIEVLFEVLTGWEYKTAGDIEKHLAADLKFQVSGMGFHDFSKCFFEHTILCALEIYKNRELLKLYADKKTLTNEEKQQKRPLLQFYNWDEKHKHGSVLKPPKTDTSLDQNQLE